MLNNKAQQKGKAYNSNIIQASATLHMATITNPEDLAKMRAACQAAASVLDHITPHMKPGITTAEVDRLCLDYMTQIGVKSATIGYAPPGYPPFPGAVCTSVNHQVCHGMPGEKVLKNGDVVNVDVTVIKDGWFGDTSRMFSIGEVSILARRLSDITYDCMWLGIDQVRPGATLGDVGHAIQRYAENAGFSVVREFCGHGIGQNFHENPQVLHYGKPGTGVVLREGMVFTVEPMINAGRREIRQLADGWTVVTRDHSLSAQWEHTIIVTATGYDVLTTSPGMPAPPAVVKAR